MDIKLTNYQVARLISLGNEKIQIETRLSDMVKVILDANGQKPDTVVAFNMDKKVLTLEEDKLITKK